MTKDYLIYGAELSPYSVKVRSYLRYKEIPHQWIIRNQQTQKEFNKLAKIQVIPLVVTPEQEVLQDSTPIIQTLEEKFSQNIKPPRHTPTPFISSHIDEYGDEWVVTPMFHYRWRYKADQTAASKRFGELFVPGWARKVPILNKILKNQAAKIFKKRMKSRLWVIGSNPTTEKEIEKSFTNLLGLLEKHLHHRPYLFGARPSLADFGLWGQIYNAWTDVSGKRIIEGGYPNVKQWVDRMLNPKKEGDFEQWSSLENTMMPILNTEVAQIFMPWVSANNHAIQNGEDSLSITINDNIFEHKVTSVQKYHTKSFSVLLEEYKAIPNKTELDVVLKSAGLLKFLE